jgi:hypothetical protein
MIVAVNYSSGAPTVEVRIWISKTTYDNITPNLFNFGSSFDGSTSSFGYASMVSKSGATAFGSGIANLSATPAADTTYATPWGSNNTSGWSTQYNSLQFIEVGLNLTRIGIDPALYASVLSSGACQSAFASIFFKSRSSASFTSNLQDFVGPFDFLQTPVMDYTLSAPTLSCTNTTGSINITNHTTAGYYTFTSINGNITGATSNSAQLNTGGSYIIQATAAQGCPVTRTDTITVAMDTFPPVASFYASSTADLAHIVLHGGNASASNYSTPFGWSQGLLWNWSGPNGFSATTQTPLADPVNGMYQLTVTEIRNGCTAIASNYIDFSVLVSVNRSLADLRSITATSFRLTNNGFPGNTHLIVNDLTAEHATLVIHNAAGAVVYSRNVTLQKGRNDLELIARQKNQLYVISLYINDQVRFIKKVIL